MENKIRLKGIMLFLFIPITLILLLMFPFGILISVSLGILIIIFHRSVARPYLDKYAMEKCIWCNTIINNKEINIDVLEKGKSIKFVSCSEDCKVKTSEFFIFTNKVSLLIKWGILAMIIIYLASVLLWYFGVTLIGIKESKNLFKGVIAVIVLFVSFFYRGSKGDKLYFPLPIHNLFLLGIKNTLWVLRIVGGIWLILVIRDVILMWIRWRL